jgi:putative hemolysin
MKTLRILVVGSAALVVVFLAGSDQGALGIPNPAAVYCHELGYGYQIVDTPEGQHGICIFPDGSSCSGWRFYECKCGGEWSYCAIHGYDWITKTDGHNPYSPDYCVCVLDGEEIGSVTDLFPAWWDDDDSDGFSNRFERDLGTDPADDCADTSDANDETGAGVSPWPPDFNDNGFIDIGDLVALRNHWVPLGETYAARFDLNANGLCDIADLVILRTYWPGTGNDTCTVG